MKTCGCGQEMPADARFCPKCGAGQPGEAAPATSAYETFADTVGLVPNVRADDNKFQGLACLAGTIVGGGLGLALGGGCGALLGGLCGLVALGFLSGLVLCVRGIIRSLGKKS